MIFQSLYNYKVSSTSLPLTMHQSKKQKRSPGCVVELICLRCYRKKNFKGNYYNSGNVITVRFPGLTKHILWSTNQECFEKYSSLNLVNGVKVDLTTSLKYPIPVNQPKKSSTSFTSSQLGLTLTASNRSSNQVTSSNQATKKMFTY